MTTTLMTKKLLVGSCVLLFCFLVLLPSPVGASERRNRQAEELIREQDERRERERKEAAAAIPQPQPQLQPPHQPKPLDAQPKKTEVLDVSESHQAIVKDGEGNEDENQLDTTGAIVISILFPLGFTLWGWYTRKNREEQKELENQEANDQEDEGQAEEDQEDEGQAGEDQVNEEGPVASSPSSSPPVSPARSPPASPSLSRSSSSSYLFSPSRSSSSSSPSSSSSSSQDRESELMLQEFQDQDPRVARLSDEDRALIQSYYKEVTLNHAQMKEIVEMLLLHVLEVKRTVNDVETTGEKNNVMQKETRSHQRKNEEDRKIKAFNKAKFVSLSLSLLFPSLFLDHISASLI